MTTTPQELPPLPKPEDFGYRDDEGNWVEQLAYTTDQMRERDAMWMGRLNAAIAAHPKAQEAPDAAIKAAAFMQIARNSEMLMDVRTLVSTMTDPKASCPGRTDEARRLLPLLNEYLAQPACYSGKAQEEMKIRRFEKDCDEMVESSDGDWVRFEDCAAAVAANPRQEASEQGREDRKRLLIDVFYQKGDHPFICGVYGKAPLHSLAEIEERLCQSITEEDDLLTDDGEYRFTAHWEPEQRGDFGRVELEGYWDLTRVKFTALDAAIEKGKP